MTAHYTDSTRLDRPTHQESRDGDGTGESTSGSCRYDPRQVYVTGGRSCLDESRGSHLGVYVPEYVAAGCK